MHPPDYFESQQRRQTDRWIQLESDPDLAGPWRQLFQQVQSPAHVISELLQNAEDAGATHVRVTLADGVFGFEHDGRDFTESDFGSICGFGLSNKRHLHTIGFRGMGFKTTFSLGPSVWLATPTLRIRFDAERFTLPQWDPDAAPPGPGMTVRVTVRVSDEQRSAAVFNSLRRWREAPASILFFRNLREIDFDGVRVASVDLGPGPVPGSRRLRLDAQQAAEVVRFESTLAEMPEEALDEVRKERNDPRFEPPAITVQVVLGLPDPQRAYVVLPTGAQLQLPFSMNAPFLQDPGRFGIKDVAVSPLNRWLLEEGGRLAASSLLAWLGDRSLSLAERVQAYGLLPPVTAAEDAPSDLVLTAMRAELGGVPLVLTSRGEVLSGDEVLAPPAVALRVWDDLEDLRQVFRGEWRDIVASEVRRSALSALQRWASLRVATLSDLWEQVSMGSRIPKPASFERLAQLHVALDEHRASRSVPRGNLLRLAIWPVAQHPALIASERVVNVKEGSLPPDLAELIGDALLPLDPQWLDFVGGQADQGIKERLQELCERCNLSQAAPLSNLASRAWSLRRGAASSSKQLLIQWARVLARHDLAMPEDFLFITAGGSLAEPKKIVFPFDDDLADFLAEDVIAKQRLSPEYFANAESKESARMKNWISRHWTRFMTLPPLNEEKKVWYSQRNFVKFCRENGMKCDHDFYRSVVSIVLLDYDFEEYSWDALTRGQSLPSALFGLCIRNWSRLYQKTAVHVTERASNGSERPVAVGHHPAKWIRKLAELPCIPDTEGRPRVPAELLMRNEQTIAFAGLEPFVHEQYDREEYRQFLRLLGVRERVGDVSGLLNRVRALAKAPSPEPLLGELKRWYDALARGIAIDEAAQLEAVRQAFRREALIPTAERSWASATGVFLDADETLPGNWALAPIHAAVRDSPLWSLLAIPQRPSPEALLDWLRGLPSAGVLEGATLERVRRTIAQMPADVWRACGHWVSLDGRWTPISWLHYATREKPALYPEIAAKTADLSMLSEAQVPREAFQDLRFIDEELSYVLLTGREAPPGGPLPTWMSALADCIARVRLSDPAEQERVRALAGELARTSWVHLGEHAELEVAPFLDGQQVGRGRSATCVWERGRQPRFLLRGSDVRSCGSIAEELGAPFAAAVLRDAIKYCVLRPPDFVREYFESVFDLDPQENPREALQDVNDLEDDLGQEYGDKDSAYANFNSILKIAVSGPDHDDGGSDEAERNEFGGSRRRSNSADLLLLKEYASLYGFEESLDDRTFTRADGSYIVRTDRYDVWLHQAADEMVPVRVYVVDHDLQYPGLAISADTWRAIETKPAAHALLVPGPRLYTGSELLDMLQSGELVLVVRSYYLRARS